MMQDAYAEPTGAAMPGTNDPFVSDQPMRDRILAVQPDGIPAELKARPQWVCWRGELRSTGKVNKEPYIPRSDRKASSTDPTTWSPFSTAQAAYARGEYDGIGYVFSADDPYAGVDLDGCRHPETGELAPWAQEIVRRLDSYTEVSPSKTGVKIFVRGTVPGPRRRTGAIEMYSQGRYFAATGMGLADTPTGVEERQDQIDHLYQETFAEPEPERPADTHAADARTPVWAVLSDADISERASAAKNGAKFTQLQSGDNTGYTSASDADLAYCTLLRFWTQDAVQIARMLRASGRYRPKLDRDDYVARTTQKALAAPGDQWQGPLAWARATTPIVGSAPGDNGAPPAQGAEPGSSPDSPGTCRFTDMGNAQRLINRYGPDLRYSYAQGRWYVWTGTHWGHDEGGAVVRKAKETVRAIFHEAAKARDKDAMEEVTKWALKSQGDARITAMIHLAQSDVPIQPAEFDRDPWLFNVANGTINLKTGELHPHRREDFLTKMAPVSHDVLAGCPLFMSFLSAIMDDNQAMMAFLQRAAGYNLTGDISEQKVIVAHGGGANGKSTLITTLLRLMGDYAKQAAPDLLLAKKGETHPTELADLLGCRFVAGIEVDEGRRLAEALVKQMTGGDRMKARFMRQDFFEFDPTHKLWLAVNHKPAVRGTDHAMWRRICLVPFTVTITDDKKDKDLPAKLQAELPGILNWALAGCLAWQHGGLQSPDEVKNATNSYRDEMDVLAHWLDDCCVITPAARTPAGDLYTSYADWCGKGGEHPLPQRTFGLRLAERGYEQLRTKVARFWKGVGLRLPDGGGGPSNPGEEETQATTKPGSPVTQRGPVTQGDAYSDISSFNMYSRAGDTENSVTLRHPSPNASPPVCDEVLAGRDADAAHARGLARKLQECENARALDHEWSCIQKGNYRSLGDPAQAAIRCVYDDHRRRLVAGGAR